MIGLSKDHPLTAPDTLELADQLLRRCAAVHNQGFLMLEANNQDIFDMVLRLTAYHYPENIALPPGIETCNIVPLIGNLMNLLFYGRLRSTKFGN